MIRNMREKEMSNREIARDLGISGNTVSKLLRTTRLADHRIRKRGLYCFSQFWTIHEKNCDTVPAVSPPFRSFIFLSLLNILALSIFDFLILRISSGFLM
jgi:hypothetical protein